MDKTLLVIDDSPVFREAITAAGEDRGWTVLASDNLKEISDWLVGHTPNRVLLDWQLPDQHRQQYASLLKEKGLTGQTLLVSLTPLDSHRERFIEENGLADFRNKPMDLKRFEEEIQLPEQPTVTHWPGLETIAAGLEVAIDILDVNINVLWSNVKAEQDPITPAQRLIIKWLQAEMQDHTYTAARRLDWDGEKRCFLETRLFQLEGSGNYWLARDWRGDGDRPHDHELLSLEQENPDLWEWLKAVVKLLAQRYAISRCRLYKVAPLPHTQGLEKAHPPLLIPLFQSGGGFDPDVSSWLGNGLLATSSLNATKVLSENYQPTPECVSDLKPDGAFQSIRYGEVGTSRIVFVVRSQANQVVAALAMDRRLDHANSLQGFDREVVEMARRMASDEAGALTKEQWSLMDGLVKDICERMLVRLTDDEGDRSRRWNEAISRAFMETFANETGRSPELTYQGMSQVCTALTKTWKEEAISGRNRGTTPWQATQEDPISTWYIALLLDQDQWQVVAGSGTAYEICRNAGRRTLEFPHLKAKDTTAWTAAVIQNFQSWANLMKPEDSYSCIDEKLPNTIGSWLAVPMQVDGKVRALMVVHSPFAHYFTALRITLMEQAAKRLLPLLAAARRETIARSVFTASVMHEVKNDSHSALLSLDELQKHLHAIHHHLEGLNALGRDALDIFRLGRGEAVQDIKDPDQDVPFILGSLIDSAILGWRTLYEDTKLKIDIPEALAARKVVIKRAQSFKRVLRALLHNAFRHGQYWVGIRVRLGETGEENGEARLELEITNPAYSDIACSLAQRLDPAIGGLGSSPLARGHLGLAVAHQLTEDAGGAITELQCEPPGNDDGTLARISFTWPVTLIEDIVETPHELFDR